MARPDKVAAVDEIAARFRGASASVVTEYRGLKMTQLIALRRALGTDTTYRVAKNTLVKRAAENAGLEGLESILVGPTAIAFINGEPSEAAKAIRDFAKENGLVYFETSALQGNYEGPFRHVALEFAKKYEETVARAEDA